MAIYLGGIKYNLMLGGTVYDLNIYSSTPITNGIRLISSDNYILKDSNGLYLTTIKEGE